MVQNGEGDQPGIEQTDACEILQWPEMGDPGFGRIVVDADGNIPDIDAPPG